MISVKMLRLLTFGGLALESRERTPAPRLRPQRLAILAVLACAGDRGVSRERMAGLFWPDADEERARHSLRQALYALRQELGTDVIQSAAVLALDARALSSDIGDFRAALAAGDRARAAALVTGPFLHGFYLPGAPEFERWVEEERASLVVEATRMLLALAKEADAARDHDAAVEWWRRLTILDPLSGRFALGYLKSLAARGDRAGALAFARAHESVVRRELEADADPEIRRLEAELRAMPSPVVPRVAPPSAPATPVSVALFTPPASAPSEALAAVVAGSRNAEAAGRAAAPNEMIGAAKSPAADGAGEAASRYRWRLPAIAAVLLLMILAGALSLNTWGPARRLRSSAATPTFAVGMIREEGVPDTLRIGGVLTDMLATNLARVAGLSVLANTRLFELMRPGQDTLATGYVEAARRAGATEILQGRLLPAPEWGLSMEIQRVDLTTGLVKGGYRVAAGDRYALIDSMTAAIARDLHLNSPAGSVSDATTDSPMAYRLYEEGLRAYYLYDYAAAKRLMQAALEEDSTFAMAAYYDARLTPDGADATPARRRALQLAARAPERERLLITADMLTGNEEPRAVAVAESLTTRYPSDPRAFELLSLALHHRGDWSDAVTAIERAIALDSASEPAQRQSCHLCSDFYNLAEIYFWWDSIPAAERTARRFLLLRPRAHSAWHMLIRAAAARGDTAGARTYLRRFDEANPQPTDPRFVLRFTTLLENYDQAERDAQRLLESPRPDEVTDGRWLLSIALRNQGRNADALRLARAGPARNFLAEALIALEQGNARAAATIFGAQARADESAVPPGIQARHRTWNNVLFGMALAAAGDTVAVRRLADTVEYWGARSLYGRDNRAHHYLRGLLLVAAKRDEEAAREFRQAMQSTSYGFTRINYELGKTLMRLGRPAEAVPVLRAALHGDIDGSNLYMTRTDLHELLAQAFDRMGNRDSAAVHYRAVVRAWERADPLYHPRRESARAWLARNSDVPRGSEAAARRARRPRPAAANSVDR